MVNNYRAFQSFFYLHRPTQAHLSIRMEFRDADHAPSVLHALHAQRHAHPALCDVRLTVGGATSVPAHRCVLAASSGYFRALFTGRFCDCRQDECTVPGTSSVKTTCAIIDYLYLGEIRICPGEVEEVLSLADYLCIEKLKEYCVEFLRNNITEENCIFIKYLCEKFSLVSLTEELSAYIAPRISKLLIQADILSLPFDFFQYLLTNKEFNHVNEQQVFQFLMRWVNYDLENRQIFIKHILNLIEMEYLPKSFIKSRILDNDGAISMREQLDKEQLESLNARVFKTESSSSTEILVCRSRSVTMGQEVQLLSYLPEDDSWHVLHTPESHMLDGLESLIRHLDAVYFLVSKTEDMYGYMHHTQETKSFSCFNLLTCVWSSLTSPAQVKGHCRLVSHVNGVYVIDRTGVVEEYDCENDQWAAFLTESSSPTGLFVDSPTSTWYVLPMALDRYLYVLRVFSTGYAFSFSQTSFSLHKLDTVRRTAHILGETEACDLDLDDKEKLHSYMAHPGALVMRNELGQPRSGSE